MISIKLAAWRKGGLDANDICITAIHSAIETLYPDLDVDPIALDLKVTRMVFGKEPIVLEMLHAVETYLSIPKAKSKDYQPVVRDHSIICAQATIASFCPQKVIKWDTPCSEAFCMFKSKYLTKIGSQSASRFKAGSITGNLTKELKDYRVPDLTVGELFTIIRYYTRYSVSGIIRLSPYEVYLLFINKMNGLFSYRDHKNESFIYYICMIKWIASVIGIGIDEGELQKPLKYSLHKPNSLRHRKGVYHFTKVKKSEFMKIYAQFY